MKEKVYVDRLFADYEETPSLRDFKEEITVNLQEHVKEFISEGMPEDEAFSKATTELGDITAIADDIAKQKRSETIVQMYTKATVPVTKRTALGMTVASAFLLLAVGIAIISFLKKSESVSYYLCTVSLGIACGLYTYFGLAQETSTHYAMKSERAVAYGIVCLGGVLGIGVTVVAFLFGGWEMPAMIGIIVTLIIPSFCGLVFLLTTEPKRYKPWFKAIMECEVENSMFHTDMVDPIKAAKFGVMSGALWLFAIALFITLAVFISWHVSWIPLLFALPVQVLMVVSIFKKN